MNPTLHVPEHLHLPDKQERDKLGPAHGRRYSRRSKACWCWPSGSAYGTFAIATSTIFVDRLVSFLHLNPEGHLSNIFFKAADHSRRKIWCWSRSARWCIPSSVLRKLMACGALAPGRSGSRSSPATIYVPFEIHALMHHPNLIKWGILLINIAIVLYMAKSAHGRKPAAPAQRQSQSPLCLD